MKCIICGGNRMLTIHKYSEPDKYEQWLRLPGGRMWERCSCGHIQARHPYDLSEFERLYEAGYRAESFRNETVQETYKRITRDPTDNVLRLSWFDQMFGMHGDKTVIDVGAGLGVFAKALSDCGWDVWCVEPNRDSRWFIRNHLNLPCIKTPEALGQADILCFVHILEHIENPVSFLKDYHKNLTVGGHIFVEVPDAGEFNTLPMDHDEFNSCHLHFFHIWSLAKVLEDAGFTVIEIDRVHYPERNLNRIYMVGRATY